jgi:UDP-glucose 4-epimerase
MKRILVIGSEGFIGKNAVKHLNSKGYDVSRADIVLLDEKGYYTINPESPNYSDIFRSGQFDICINASGAANVQFSFNYPYVDYFLNTANVYAMLEAIRLNNENCRFINLSSAAVYGNPQTSPVKETHNINPISPYGFHKLYSEQICREYFQLFNIKTISLRIFSAYGRGLKKQLFWDLYSKAKGKVSSIQMYGTGNESRDFIYIYDLIEAIRCIIEAEFFTGEAINVSSGVECTVKNAIEIFLSSYNKNISVEFSGHNKKGDPLNWKADIGMLQSLGFINQYTLKEGIIETLKWLRDSESD